MAALHSKNTFSEQQVLCKHVGSFVLIFPPVALKYNPLFPLNTLWKFIELYMCLFNHTSLQRFETVKHIQWHTLTQVNMSVWCVHFPTGLHLVISPQVCTFYFKYIVPEGNIWVQYNRPNMIGYFDQQCQSNWHFHLTGSSEFQSQQSFIMVWKVPSATAALLFHYISQKMVPFDSLYLLAVYPVVGVKTLQCPYTTMAL